MRRIFRIISLVLCLFLLSGCFSGNNSSKSQTIQYECNHGLLNQDIYTTGLNYKGNPIELEYAFNNVNMDSNFGLMLFLNGKIQPFTLDEYSESNIHIVDLPKNTTSKSVNISFNPIMGQRGETLQLFIIALFDAGPDYHTPTLAPAFYHSLSQSLPISIYMEKDASVTAQTTYTSLYSCNFSAGSPEAQNDATYDDIAFSGDLLSLDRKFEFSLTNASDIDTNYYIYAYVNNVPIEINEKGLFPLSCPAKSKITVTAKLLGSSIQDDDLFYVIAVPSQNIDIEHFQSTLKTKTLPLSE